MRFLYSALFYLLLPLILLRMLWRSRQAPAYRRRLAERFGLFAPPAPAQQVIWVHAVSVGETLAAAPMIEAMLARWPDYRLVVTTTTPTGSERVAALFGERVFHVYSPWDLPGAVARFFDRVHPSLLVIMETELWPNLLHHCRRRGCRVMLANARMSERSARGYGRFRALTREMLAGLDAVACQSRRDGERLVALGLPPARMAVTGSIKFDVEIDAALRAEAEQLARQWQRPVLLGSSTHPGEEALVLEAYAAAREQLPELLCLLVPRHPERFEAVYQLCRSRGFDTARRSLGETVTAGHQVLLGDTMGELRLLSGAASVCVIGGSFIEHGGQNVLEAAAWGVPVVSGPHMFNFSEITELLTAAGGMIQLQEAAGLAPCVCQLLVDERRRRAMGAAARKVVEDNRGARERQLAMIAAVLAGG